MSSIACVISPSGLVALTFKVPGFYILPRKHSTICQLTSGQSQIELTMAEVLAIVGGISSVVTIAEVAGKLVQCCRSLITDVKNAPKDIKKLVEELEILRKNAEGIEGIIRDTESLELRTKVDGVVRLALEGCVNLVDELMAVLNESAWSIVLRSTS